MKLFLTSLICLLCGLVMGQSIADKQDIELNTNALSALHLYNYNGKVKVRGVNGSVARISANRNLSSASSNKLEEARQNLKLDTMLVDGALYIFVNSEEYQFEIDKDGIGRYNSCCNWESRNSRIGVDFEFEILLEVPKSLELYVATHRKDLDIEGIDGQLYARNHHDDLSASGLSGNVVLLTHHGNIEADFSKNPTSDCVYKTHHGDIKITYQSGFSGIASFKSRHGSFYTDFDWSPEPVSYQKTQSGRGTKYQIGNVTAIKINDGGPSHDFRTWHGDIFIERQ